MSISIAIRTVLWGSCLLAASSALGADTAPRPQTISLPDRIGWGGGAPVRDPERYLQEQLHPGADDGLPAAVQAQIDAMTISQTDLADIARNVGDERMALRQERKAMPAPEAPATMEQNGAKPRATPARREYRQTLQELAREAATRSLLRDIYSKNQLKEQLTWFWFNHFNVNQRKGVIAAMVGDYEEHAIRPHVLGKFRDLLIATAFHPAMLQYLDNQQNAVGHINENFAREIMELHTMGVGSGYTQKDVQELARILTGVGANFAAQARPGLQARMARGSDVAFARQRHDFGDKLFLGQTIKGTGADEAVEALTLLSRQPATAKFVSRKLALFFCSDAPSDRLVSAMAATFQQTDGDIAAVLSTLFHDREFEASLGRKFKDPLHYAISTVRAAYGETPVQTVAPLFDWLTRMGEPLYGHETPDGYALTQDAWSGPGAMAMRFEVATAAGAGKPSLSLPDGMPPRRAAQMARNGRVAPDQGPALPPDLKDAPYVQVFLTSIAPATRTALSKANSPADWNMLFLSSPEFMYR